MANEAEYCWPWSLAGDPPLVLADEPGAALDIAHRIRMLEVFKNKSKSAACLILVCLHDLDLAFHYFDHFILLNQGQSLYAGPGGQLFEQPLLDQVFGVEFLRLSSSQGPVLQPGRLIVKNHSAYDF